MKYVRLGLWSIAIVATLFGATAWRREGLSAVESTSVSLAVPEPITIPSADALDSAAAFLVDNNLFRFSRGPADSALAAVSVKPATQPQLPPKPKLVLRGVIGGPPWDAIIDGIPGAIGGRVIRDGEALHGFAVRVVHRDMVIVRGADTVWTLTLSHP